MDWRDKLSRDFFGEFQGKIVIVAGGAQGIGAALADGLHWLGAKVVIIDKNGAAAAPLLAALEKRALEEPQFGFFQPVVIQANLAVASERASAIQRIMASVGSPYAFISTIGNDERIAFDELSQGSFEAILADNLMAPFLTAKELLPAIRSGGEGGAICLFLSRHGGEKIESDMAAYGVAKAGLAHAVKYLAQRAGLDNTPANAIHVFGFCPGWVHTENQKRRFTEAQFAAGIAKRIVPRAITPEDLVAPVLFHLSSAGSLSAGQVVQFDGGEI